MHFCTLLRFGYNDQRERFVDTGVEFDLLSWHTNRSCLFCPKQKRTRWVNRENKKSERKSLLIIDIYILNFNTNSINVFLLFYSLGMIPALWFQHEITTSLLAKYSNKDVKNNWFIIIFADISNKNKRKFPLRRVQSTHRRVLSKRRVFSRSSSTER